MHIIFKIVLMLVTESYQNWSTLVEATACQSWRIFLSHSVQINTHNVTTRRFCFKLSMSV